MEKILLNLVKIIIIGCWFNKATVFCNRQFLPPPPFPYYQGNNYYMRNLASPNSEPLPMFYDNENIHPPPVLFKEPEFYSPPQLFHRNKNYNLHHTPLGEIGRIPPIFPHIMNPPPPPLFVPPPPMNIKLPQQKFQNFPFYTKLEANSRSPTTFQQKIKVQTNTIQQEKNYPSYYQDDNIKNYHDEDYLDYSEDSTSQSNLCKMDSPYRFFEPIKLDPNYPQHPCNPYFQHNFGKPLLSLKTPITLLPSRFPPRVEQFIERIQNHFSTYTQQGQPNIQNQTLLSSNVPTTTISNETSNSVPLQTTNFNKKNSTTETQVTFTVTLEPLDETTFTAINNFDQVTEKPDFVSIQNSSDKETKSSQNLFTEEKGVQNEKDLQQGVQNMSSLNEAENMSSLNEVTTDISLTTESTITDETTSQSIYPIDSPVKNFSDEEYVNVTEKNIEKVSDSPEIFESETKVMDFDNIDATTKPTEEKTENYNIFSTTNEIFHSTVENNG